MLEIIEFKDIHIEDAAKLFHHNYLDLKEEYKFLPDKYVELETIISNLENMIKEFPAYVAIDSNKIVGYMAGYSKTKKSSDNFTAYVPEWGHSSIPDGRKEQVYNELYRSISAIWLDYNNNSHLISFLKTNNIKDNLCTLGFGLNGIEAVREFEIIKCNKKFDFLIEIAQEKHISQLKEIDFQLYKHLELPPAFLRRNAKKKSDEKIIEKFISEEQITLVAVKDNEIISCIHGDKNHGNMSFLDTNGTFGISFGYSKSKYRNTGVASILLNEIIQLAKKENFVFCSTDFESANIEASSFWLKYFQPVTYTMLRKIDA